MKTPIDHLRGLSNKRKEAMRKAENAIEKMKVTADAASAAAKGEESGAE